MKWLDLNREIEKFQKTLAQLFKQAALIISYRGLLASNVLGLN